MSVCVCMWLVQSYHDSWTSFMLCVTSSYPHQMTFSLLLCIVSISNNLNSFSMPIKCHSVILYDDETGTYNHCKCYCWQIFSFSAPNEVRCVKSIGLWFVDKNIFFLRIVSKWYERFARIKNRIFLMANCGKAIDASYVYHSTVMRKSWHGFDLKYQRLNINSLALSTKQNLMHKLKFD